MAGHVLPTPPAPAGRYDAVTIRGGIGCVSGQFPIRDGILIFRGAVGAERTTEDGRAACRIAAQNVLAQVAAATRNFADLDGFLRLDGHVASAPGVTAQPVILDVASALFVDVLGERGRHARTAFAPARLPLDATVELCLTFAVRQRGILQP